jgi:hypothetical protein
MLNPTISPNVSIDVSNQVASKLKIKNLNAILVMPHLPKATTNALIDHIAMTHMERRVR